MRIAKAKTQDEKELEFSDFNVIIGGNSVGKTTLLVELYSLAVDQNRPRWYWLSQGSGLEYTSQKPVEDLRLLRSSFTARYEAGNVYYFSRAARNPEGALDQDGKFRFTPAEYRSTDEILRAGDVEAARAILKSNLKFWRPFVSFANCEMRLSLTGQVNVTPLDQPPQDALNLLHRDRNLQREIDERLFGQFQMHPALLRHRLTQLDFGLSREVPPDFDANAVDLEAEYRRIEDWRADNFTTIADVGHGIRSMMKLLISLQEPVSQIVLIDEPEMHIYPAQKRWLGRELVRLAHEQGKQVFMVTHDPIILQGILDSEGETQVLRISFDANDERQIQASVLKNLDEIGAKRNQDSYLQALFYQRTVAVEGAADRAFYQIMTEELMGDRIADKDLGFVACGGVGQSKNVASLASQVGLMSAFIYDFDALTSGLPVLIEIMDLRGKDAQALKELQALYVQKRLTNKELSDEGRKGPASGLVTANQELFDAARAELRSAGIHIVPYGTLESWAESVEEKARFPREGSGCHQRSSRVGRTSE